MGLIFDTGMELSGLNEDFGKHSAFERSYSSKTYGMRPNEEYWEKFEKSGTILDYLTYSACTKEM